MTGSIIPFLIRRPLLCLPVLLASAPCWAAAEPSSSSAPIVVEGARNRDQQIKAFIKDMTPAPTRGQLGRFELPVCPVVLGIAETQARAVEQRMRTVAKAAGLAVAKPGCLTNMAVLVGPSKAALLKELEHWPYIFPEEWSGKRIEAMQRDPSPVAAWHTEQVVWPNGMPLAARETGIPDSSLGPLRQLGLATRLQPSTRPTFTKSVVVIQSGALAGLTPVQLADYALMRSLVQTDPKANRSSNAATILSIVDAPMGAAVPPTLTQWDLSFLRAFYSSTKNMYAEYQRAQMKSAMKHEIDRENAAR